MPFASSATNYRNVAIETKEITIFMKIKMTSFWHLPIGAATSISDSTFDAILFTFALVLLSYFVD